MIVYQILPRLWGYGRMSSVDDCSLEYFRSLGVTHVWYTGLIRHSTGKPFVKGDPGSPFAISDYFDINPYLADNPKERISEFEKLIKRTHGHGLKVIMDFVPNHIGLDYADSEGGIPHFNWHDYDWSDTRKIDYSHPGTWETMYRIVRFWAAKGVDGFRCDMAELVSSDFFRWLISRIKAEFPDVIFIAEVYQKERYREYTEHAGFDYLYDKSGLYDTLRSVVGGRNSVKAVTWNWQQLGDLQPKMLNFLENHDEQRIASPWFAGRKDCFACIGPSALFNTAPFMLYFGQEIGLDASEGHEGRTSIFSWNRPEALMRLYSYIHGHGNLTDEETMVLEKYGELLGIASENVVTKGLTYDLCYCQNTSGGFDPDKHFAFIRHDGKDILLVVSNFSMKDCNIRITIPEHAFSYLGLDRERVHEKIDLQVKALDTLVMKL